jgi:flagellum-specific peptidoglycan hydrolase FlgJ
MTTEQNSNKEEFKSALYLAEVQKFDKWAIYTQAYLETGNFSSSLCEVFNYWGLKWREKMGTHWVEKRTKEIVNGKEIEIIDKFQAFGSQYQALTEYTYKIKHDYPNAYVERDNYRKFFCGLLNGVNQWSTSPTYADNLINLYERLKDGGEFV